MKLKNIKREDIIIIEEMISDEDIYIPKIDNYGFVKNYFGFIIILNSKAVGFILINNECMLLERQENNYNIQEIFILEEYGQNKLGFKTLLNILNLYKGNWEIKPALENEVALKFWRNIIKKYTNNNYKELVNENGRIIITFSNK